MSQIAPLSEGPSVGSLALVVLLLVPCVVLLLLLNCLFLVCRLLFLSKQRCRSRRGAADQMLLRSTLHAVSDASFSPLPRGRGARASLPERVIVHPVTSSRASSRGAHGAGHRMWLGGSPGFHRGLSTIRATTSSSTRVAPGPDRLSGLRFSESEVRVDLVPPNSPTDPLVPPVWDRFGAAGEPVTGRGRNLEQEVDQLPHHGSNMAADRNPDVVGLHSDFLDLTSGSSAKGPGLDGDFGASAGVSLRILSADSDGLSNGVLASALEWDYYDPCYVRQNNVPRQQRRRPALHTKHYWV